MGAFQIYAQRGSKDVQSTIGFRRTIKVFLKLSSHSHNPNIIRNTCDEGRIRFDKRTKEERRGSLDENTKQIRGHDRNGGMHPLKWKQLNQRINDDLRE